MPWKKGLLFLGLALGLGGILLLLLSILTANYSGRMRDDEALNVYQLSLPARPRGTIPLGGGIEVLRKADPRRLRNPRPLTRAVLDQGRQAYSHYCWPCHGPELDGKATVGQSFYPLPTDLLGPTVQNQSDGELFYKISLGYKRQPPLYATLAAADRWAVIHYLRALARKKG
ncbi:MAG: c-type cytochrome [Deltaproteobacteria bacterium]|nr:c-type cytochrome [Deltaproteobacteria bacterium]